MSNPPDNPRILIVTPEVTYLPEGMGNLANGLSAKAGGLADVSSALISALFDQGADVHVTLPDYRHLFGANCDPLMKKELHTIKSRIPFERIHLAKDRAFFYLRSIYSKYSSENLNISLAFQREVINNIIPQVQPDIIHCNDWVTGLIPAVARKMNIPCLFTIHNIYTTKCPMSYIEDRGIDAASFWQHLFFEYVPGDYEQARESDPVDFLVSGIFASHFVNSVSPTFLNEVAEGRHSIADEPIRQELSRKKEAGCATGILNAPDPSFDPSSDDALGFQYSAGDHFKGKKINKLLLQETLGLIQDESAPLFFWPSRLERTQKGCQLLAEILYDFVSRYWEHNVELVFVADGEFQRHFKDIVRFHALFNRVAVCGFDECLARLAYGASDFVLMPSLFEPCGLPQMIGPLYGALPVAHDTGGIHDTVTHMDIKSDTGNGFLFETFNSEGLFWAIEQAMLFHKLPGWVREKHIKRIMEQSETDFNYSGSARQYIALYEQMLQRPLIPTHVSRRGSETKSKAYQIGGDVTVKPLEYQDKRTDYSSAQFILT